MWGQPPSAVRRSEAPQRLPGKNNERTVEAMAAAVIHSMMTVDCPEISNRFRQRMFLQAIMSSFRTM